MAENTTSEEQQETLPSFGDSAKKKARAWFKQAETKREQRDYDYAVECYILGLGFWPEAVEEGHQPLRSLAVQRAQAGGKKPGMMDSLKRSMTGKDAKKAMLNAEYLASKDPSNGSYLDGILKNAAKGLFLDTLAWVAPLTFDSMKKDKKPNTGRFKTFRQVLADASDAASAAGENAKAAFLLEQAVASVDYLLARGGDDALRDEQRDLSGRLTILKGKYSEAESFRDSIQDADAQKVLHDEQRGKQGKETQQGVIDAARAEYEKDPSDSRALTKYIEALVRSEEAEYENQAIATLEQAHTDQKNYKLKSRADDIRIRQLTREARQAMAQAKKSGSDEDKQQARLLGQELLQLERKVYQERAEKYPTDLRIKYRLGRVLFAGGEYDAAIPVLQQAQGDPRSRLSARLLIGRSFFETGSFGQAREVLKEALDEHETPSDDMGKDLLYWLARSLEANGETEPAKEQYGRLLRQDYNYANGEARERLEALKSGE